MPFGELKVKSFILMVNCDGILIDVKVLRYFCESDIKAIILVFQLNKGVL